MFCKSSTLHLSQNTPHRSVMKQCAFKLCAARVERSTEACPYQRLPPREKPTHFALEASFMFCVSFFSQYKRMPSSISHSAQLTTGPFLSRTASFWRRKKKGRLEAYDPEVVTSEVMEWHYNQKSVLLCHTLLQNQAAVSITRQKSDLLYVNPLLMH